MGKQTGKHAGRMGGGSRPLAGLALGIALVLGSGNAAAQFATTEVGPNLVQSIMNQINTYSQKLQDVAEYGEQQTRWLATLKQYQQQLVKIQAQLNSIGLPQGADLKPVAPDYLVSENCGGGMEFSMSGAFQQFVFDPGKDLKQQQKEICANIRMIQNRKYNEAVTFLGTTAPQMQSSLNRIFSMRLGSNDQGNVQGADSESLRLANDMQVQAQNWEARMRAYDAYIEVMKQNQNVIAQSALKGKPNALISDLVKTAALKGALTIPAN